jgi:hypothetical protein
MVLATLPLASKIRKRTLFSTSKFSDIQGASWTVGSIGSKAATRRRRRRRRIRIRQDIDVIVRFGNAVAR